MNIIFYGGTFDPFHKGHLRIAQTILAAIPDSLVLLAPAPVPPHKKTEGMTSFDVRLEMVTAAVSDISGMVPCDIEKERTGKSYSIDTLRLLKKKYPGDTVMLLIGGDSLLQLHTWYHAHELVSEFPVLTYPRPGESLALDCSFWSPEEIRKLTDGILHDVPEFPVSATQIRKMFASGDSSADGLVPEQVLAVIRKYALYGKKR